VSVAAPASSAKSLAADRGIAVIAVDVTSATKSLELSEPNGQSSRAIESVTTAVRSPSADIGFAQFDAATLSALENGERGHANALNAEPSST
jgi:hypothetical protein